MRPTLLAGLTVMAITTVTFGFADSLFRARRPHASLQGAREHVHVDGARSPGSLPPLRRSRRGEPIGAAMGAAIFGALFGPVIGGVASVIGTGPAFASVAVLATVLAVWALRIPAFKPSDPQPISRLFGALGDQGILASIWFVLLPALLFGVLDVLGPLRLDVLGFGALAIGLTWLVSASFEAVARARGRPDLGPPRPPRCRFVPGSSAPRRRPPLLPWHRPRLAARCVHRARRAARSARSGRPPCRWSPTERRCIGLDYAYGFALINLAWAPGAAAGAALGGAAARATSDAAVYLTLSGACVVSMLMLAPRLREPAPSAST